MASTADFRNGMTIDHEGVVFSIVEFQHVKPGKGGAFVRTKLRNVKSGAVIDRTFRSGEKVTELRMETRNVQFIYMDGDNLVVMDNETYEQVMVPAALLGDQRKFLLESMQIAMGMIQEKPITLELPNFVEQKIAQTDPGFRGDTAQGATKPATLESGATVMVPLFLEIGDTLKVDTRTGRYLERVGRG